MIKGPVSMTADEAAVLRKWGNADLVTWAARAAVTAAAAPVRAAWGAFAAVAGTLRPPRRPAPDSGTSPAAVARPRAALRLLQRFQLPGAGSDDDPAGPAPAAALGAPVIDP